MQWQRADWLSRRTALCGYNGASSADTNSASKETDRGFPRSLIHEAKGLAHAFTRDDAEERGLFKLYFETLPERVVKHRIVRRTRGFERTNHFRVARGSGRLPRGTPTANFHSPIRSDLILHSTQACLFPS